MSAGAQACSAICIVGAGAIGGVLGVRLSQKGHNVTFFARGAHLAAMQSKNCLTLRSPDGSVSVSGQNSQFVATLDGLPPQDYIILGLKMHQIRDVLPGLQALLRSNPNATIVGTQNGVPWWFFQCYKGLDRFRDHVLESVDPGGALFHGIDPARVVSTVVYPAAHIEAPGVIHHTEGVRFPVGELSGDRSTQRIVQLSEVLIDAGFKSPILDDVRAELWLKLWGSVAFNPVSALTHATLEELCNFSSSRTVIEKMMLEVEAVANAVGVKMRVPLERRLEGAGKVGDHKPSTLQDCESGRPMEIDSIMGAVIEIAQMTGTSTPYVDAIYGVVSTLAQILQKHDAAVPMVAKESLQNSK